MTVIIIDCLISRYTVSVLRTNKVTYMDISVYVCEIVICLVMYQTHFL
jgi:hypothetical protein